jgi:N-acetylglutamate synthase-like GNAT family acetyltransferase
MRVRRFKPADAAQCSRIAIKNFSTVNSKEYPKKTIQQLIKHSTAKGMITKSKKGHYFVAVEKGKVVGMGGYKDDELHSFFVDPRMHGKRIGKAILIRVLKEAKKEGICVMKCYSSFYGEKFYAACGFHRIRKKKILYHGATLTYIDMRKKL